ncbi:unnamed protein product [Pelagomonas calceolata]|uniref:Uncharacterized protein n=1 Tax=Pelagomonas calceolata TaxID=35677 RepID=A0A8J2X014_9STRA|nr:unnamed protein product [Pelagomonas calceolata]
MASSDEIPPALEADFVALRKLRDDDESGALKEYFGGDEDPREWKQPDGDTIVTVEDGRVTELDLYKCSSLVALPDAIGELGALRELNMLQCGSLTELPEAIGKLTKLMKFRLSRAVITVLPDSIGKLGALTELTYSVQHRPRAPVRLSRTKRSQRGVSESAGEGQRYVQQLVQLHRSLNKKINAPGAKPPRRGTPLTCERSRPSKTPHPPGSVA